MKIETAVYVTIALWIIYALGSLAGAGLVLYILFKVAMGM